MESTSSKIRNVIKKIKPLLENAEENYWFQYFENVEEEFGKKNNDEVIQSLRMIFKGGMGSFSDLVLHKNGIALVEENNELEKLKDDLYDLCEEKA